MGTLDYQNRDDAWEQASDRLLRSLAGTPRRRPVRPAAVDVWPRLAAELGGRFVPGRAGRRGRVRVPVGGRTLMLDAGPRTRPGGPPVPFTQVWAPYVSADGFGFRAHPAGVLSLVRELFDGDVKVGDHAFDEAFVLRGTDRRQVAALFADPAVRATVRRRPEAVLEAEHRSGWSVTDPRPGDPFVLSLTAAGPPTDAARVRLALDVVAAVLGRLTAIGSAVPPPV